MITCSHSKFRVPLVQLCSMVECIPQFCTHRVDRSATFKAMPQLVSSKHMVLCTNSSTCAISCNPIIGTPCCYEGVRLFSLQSGGGKICTPVIEQAKTCNQEIDYCCSCCQLGTIIKQFPGPNSCDNQMYRPLITDGICLTIFKACCLNTISESSVLLI